jgi:3-deoxy-manno-octulosonate cytidylyltransferase (CMP-KDO synthetase)
LKTQNTKGRVIGIIPARYGSTRLPGKALAVINGKLMIQRVYEQASKSKLLSEVIIATDDLRIFQAAKNFGGNVVMTSGKHKSGTDRIGEIVNRRRGELANCSIVVNIQGDEPYINPVNIDKAITPLLDDSKLNVSTLAFKIVDKKEISDPNAVKVIFDSNSNAIYFSRNPVPYDRDKKGKVDYYKHIGLYVYRMSYLKEFVEMKPSSLELAEKLEQLRILENGGKIRVVVTKADSVSIDTKADLHKVRKLYA